MFSSQPVEIHSGWSRQAGIIATVPGNFVSPFSTGVPRQQSPNPEALDIIYDQIDGLG
jgi:hypothetical protein